MTPPSKCWLSCESRGPRSEPNPSYRCSPTTAAPRGAPMVPAPAGPGVRKKAGVDKSIRLHDLRHWQATQLLDPDVPLPTVAARLGHASGMTTIKIYAHRTAQADEQAATIVGDVLGGGD